jgi:hypothetical protein
MGKKRKRREREGREGGRRRSGGKAMGVCCPIFKYFRLHKACHGHRQIQTHFFVPNQRSFPLLAAHHTYIWKFTGKDNKTTLAQMKRKNNEHAQI